VTVVVVVLAVVGAAVVVLSLFLDVSRAVHNRAECLPKIHVF
jgi:hypothetical protein